MMPSPDLNASSEAMHVPGYFYMTRGTGLATYYPLNTSLGGYRLGAGLLWPFAEPARSDITGCHKPGRCP